MTTVTDDTSGALDDADAPEEAAMQAWLVCQDLYEPKSNKILQEILRDQFKSWLGESAHKSKKMETISFLLIFLLGS